MNKHIFYELAKQASRNLNYDQKKRWKRKLKYFALFAFVGTLLIGGLAIWGTVAIIDKVASSIHSGSIPENIAKGQEGIAAIASQPIITKSCLDTMGVMLSPTRLLTVPLAQNIDLLRGACLEKPKPIETQNKQT